MISAAVKDIKNVKLITYLLGFLSFILLVVILKILSSILIPVTIAIFLTFLFHPLVTWFKKFGIPTWVTLLIIISSLFFLNYLLSLLIISNLNDLTLKADLYSANLMKYIEESDLNKMTGLRKTDLNLQGLVNKIFNAASLSWALSFTFNFIIDFFLALIFFIFMLTGKNRFETRLKLAFEEKIEVIDQSINSIDIQLQSYLVVKTIISLIVGAATFLVLYFFNIDFALFWGFLTFLLNFIPNIGAVMASVFPVSLAVFQYGISIRSIGTAVLLLVIHNLMGNLVEPHYLGKQMDLSPVFVLLSLIFWGWIWGVTGMFLAVPIAAVIKILLQNIKPLQPLSKILGHKL